MPQYRTEPEKNGLRGETDPARSQITPNDKIQRGTGRKPPKAGKKPSDRNGGKKESKRSASRSLPEFNPVYVFFTLLLVYLAARVASWTNTSSIAVYTVPAASDSASRTDYSGIILRDETEVSADAAGTVQYLAAENEKASVGGEVCVLDTDGSFSAQIDEDQADGLSENVSDEVRRRILQSGREAQRGDFLSAAEEADALSSLIRNSAMLDAVVAARNSGTLSFGAEIKTAEQSGYVLYSTDSLSGLTEEEVTAESFDSSRCASVSSWSGKSVISGDFLWRTVPDDSFTVVFEISGTEAESWEDSREVSVYLSEEQTPATGVFHRSEGADGTGLGCIELNQYGFRYLSERYITFRVQSSETSAYQIPRSAVTTKDYFVVPASYVTIPEDGTPTIDIEQEDGSTLTAKISVYSEFQSEDGDQALYYLIACTSLQEGDYLVSGATESRYLASLKSSITGVYQVNRGYCIFRQVRILREDEDYCFVATDTKYGITMNDRIVMDADSVEENQIL
ncbi:MAG: HlyD family efflux transporter periplasmic adaptor subunit [Lachnospiraceae bacterium]|jgi:hypothetical protein